MALDSVVAVSTATDLEPLSLHWMPTLAGDKQMVLADGKVLFQGQEVAFVVAKDRYIAADAVDLVAVEYEKLPVIVNPFKSLQSDVLLAWVGGCARGAVSKAAREAIATVTPQLIALRPHELREAEGLTAGDLRDGVRFARNGCPAKGPVDVFVEPVLSLPEMITGRTDQGPNPMTRVRQMIYWLHSRLFPLLITKG